MSILDPSRTAAMQAAALNGSQFVPDRHKFATRIVATIQEAEQVAAYKAHRAAFLRKINRADLDMQMGNIGLAKATLELARMDFDAAIKSLPV